MGKVVDVTLRLIDKMTGPLGKAEGALKNHAYQIMKAGGQIQRAGKKITGVGTSMTKAVTAPVAAMGVTAVKNFGEVDKSMRLVKSTMGETKWATEDLAGAIKKSAANSVFSMQDATDATLNFARQGYDAKKAADMLTPSLDLAAGTATDLSTVTSGLGNTLKVFSSQGLTASKAADVFAKAQAQANTTTTELFDAMSVGSSTFKTVGWSMQDLATVTGVLGDNFISGSEGATAMKTGLARLAENGTEVAKWTKRLNIELFNSDGTMKSMTTVQSQLHKSFSKLTQEQQMQAASAMFGKNQMGKWLTLIGTAPKTVKKYRTALDDASGTANKMGESLMSGVGGSIEKMKSTFDVFKYSVGEAIAEPVKKVIDKITGLINKFNGLDSAQQKTIVKVALVAAAVGPLIAVFGKTVSTVGKVVLAVGKFGKMLRKFGSIAGLLTSPAGIVIGVLAAIAVGAVVVYKNWDKIRPVFNKVATQIKKMVATVKPAFDSMLKTVAKVMPKIKSMVTGAIKAIMPFIRSAISLIRNIASVIGKVLSKAIKAIIPVIKKIGSVFNVVFPVIVSVVSTAVGNIVTAIKKVQPVFSVVCSAVGGFVSALGDTISTIFSGVMKTLGGVIDFVSGVFTGNWKKAWTGVKSIFSGIFSSLAGVVKAPINAVIGLVNGAIQGFNRIKIPDWVPGVGGKGINIPLIPKLAKGTNNWKGGIVQISERGGEIVDLPKGSRVYPHDKSVKKAYDDGRKSTGGSKKVVVNIPKIADSIVVREDADIDRLAKKLADKLEKVLLNIGGDDPEYIY